MAFLESEKFQSGSNNIKIAFIQSFSEYPKIYFIILCMCVCVVRCSGEKRETLAVVRGISVLCFQVRVVCVRRLNKFMYMNAAKWKTTKKKKSRQKQPEIKKRKNFHKYLSKTISVLLQPHHQQCLCRCDVMWYEFCAPKLNLSQILSIIFNWLF